MPKQGEDLGINPGYEVRHCFKQEAHTGHKWHGRYWCEGFGIDPETMKVLGAKVLADGPGKYTEIVNPSATFEPIKPAILDGRTAYGDKVQNQVEQADMINAYLSGRKVQPVDVPMILILIKVHRIGKMPDYKDSYDDVEGYLSIAKDVIGSDMIEATTAKEYMEIKNRGNQGDGRAIAEFLKSAGVEHRHPYVFAEREAIREQDAQDFLDEQTPNEHTVE